MYYDIKFVIEGVEFAIETVNFMLFILQEANQVSIMAYKEALRKEQWATAWDILQNYCYMSQGELRRWVIAYGMVVTPSWIAFWVYQYLTKTYLMDLQQDLIEKIDYEIVKEGYDPNKKLDGAPFRDYWMRLQK